jgi:hypothetical protein
LKEYISGCWTIPEFTSEKASNSSRSKTAQQETGQHSAFFNHGESNLSRLRHFIFVAMVLSLTWCDPWSCPDNCPDQMEGRWKAWADRAGVQIPAYNPFQVEQNNLLPLPPGRTLIFERNESDTEGSFVCSACRKDFHTADPAEGMARFNAHTCERKGKRADG